MMKKLAKMLVVVLSAALMITALTACGGSQDEKKDAITGSWKGSDKQRGDYSWTFDGKGACTFKNQYYEASGEYTLDEKEKTVSITTIWDDEKVLNYTVTDTTLEMQSKYQSFSLTKVE